MSIGLSFYRIFRQGTILNLKNICSKQDAPPVHKLHHTRFDLLVRMLLRPPTLAARAGTVCVNRS
jgi:hypothetical protein